MKLINLNKHAILYRSPSGDIISLPPSPNPCVVAATQCVVGDLNGVPIQKTTFGEVQNLPEPDPSGETVFVVNQMILTALGGRRGDVVGPDTGPTAVRFTDGPQKGQIQHVTRWVV